MKIAFFPLPSDRAESIAEDREALLAELSRRGEVGIFLEGVAASRIVSSHRVHDLAAVHYRNLLFEYDVVVYDLAGVPPAGAGLEALREWPGILVLRGEELEPLLARECERSLAGVVCSPRLAERLRHDDPWTAVFGIEPPGGVAEIAAAIDTAFAWQSAHRGAHWLRTLLETACAELPGFVPAERSAPWRAELDELVGLAEPSRRVK